MLPYVKIEFQNGALGAISPSPDGLLGIVVSAVAVPETFELNKPYILNSYDDLATLGINATNNAPAEKVVKEFYNEAGTGTRVYIIGISNTVSMADSLDITISNSAARVLIETSQGAIRGIIISHTPASGYEPVITDGINEDVYNAIEKGQQLGEWAASQFFAPVFVIIEGRDYQGDPTQLRDLTKQTDNRVAVLIGDTEQGTNGAAMGLVAGRIAKIPVQRNIGRVKDGALATQNIFIHDISADLADVASLNEKGFIAFRSWVGRTGYFFTDDNLATLPTDDYKFLSLRRIIDKAYRVCYDTMVNEALDEVPTTTEGKMQPVYAKNIQGLIESAIANNMTANGELSTDPSDPNDRGVEVFIDLEQLVVSTGRIEVVVRVRPFGYARYVDIKLGFTVVSQS